MNTNSLVIITEERRAGGLLSAAKVLGGRITAAVAGPRSLADTIAAWGFDRVLCLETANDEPVEAYSAQFAQVAAETAPRLVLASDASAARILLGAVAAKLGAAVISSVRALAVEGDSIIVSRSAADSKVLEDIEVTGDLAGIFDGEEVDVSSFPAVPVEIVPVGAEPAMRLVEILEPEGGDGLLTAARVVAVGAGLSAKDDLKLISDLAQAVRAEVGCSLPLCEDLRWLSSHLVIGSSHNQVGPELYIGVGISGQPQHMAGIRDAKIVVAVNNDPEARIFKNCNYGIVGDLYKIVPELTSAFGNLD